MLALCSWLKAHKYGNQLAGKHHATLDPPSPFRQAQGYGGTSVGRWMLNVHFEAIRKGCLSQNSDNF